MELNIKKLHPDAKMPTYAHDGDAGFDLYALKTHTITPGSRVSVGVGLAMEIPNGYVGLIWDKSGLSLNHGLKTIGGVIDAGFRGEVAVSIMNLSTDDYIIEAGHKVAQMLIQKVERAEIKEVAELSNTTRGANGYGSTGK